MSTAPAWLAALLQRLAADRPERVLLVAPPGHPLQSALRERLPGAALELAADAAQLPDVRVPLAVVAATLEAQAPAEARELLAALRDRVAAHVVLWVDGARSPLDEAALRALGYRIHARDGAELLGGFDLYDYKDRPDWLNARDWARPELWDKFRW